MYHNMFISLVALSLMLVTTECIVCTQGMCAAVQCLAVEGCDGPNQEIRAGGFCRCCNQCFTLLSENATCSNLANILRGVPPPTAECGKGLICHEGTCKSFKVLGTTAIKVENN